MKVANILLKWIAGSCTASWKHKHHLNYQWLVDTTLETHFNNGVTYSITKSSTIKHLILLKLCIWFWMWIYWYFIIYLRHPGHPDKWLFHHKNRKRRCQIDCFKITSYTNRVNTSFLSVHSFKICLIAFLLF